MAMLNARPLGLIKTMVDVSSVFSFANTASRTYWNAI